MRPLPRTVALVAALSALLVPARSGPALAGPAPADPAQPHSVLADPAFAGAVFGGLAAADLTHLAAGSGARAQDGPWLLWAAGEPDAEGTGGAYAYDTELVPPGAQVSLVSLSMRHGTRTVLAVRGLRPGHTYGTHLHVNPCTSDPAAAGPHYQQRVGATNDPEFANPTNEVWLDVRSDETGVGIATSHNPWKYRAAPGSVVLHANPTSTDPGSPGTAGARAACVTLSAR